MSVIALELEQTLATIDSRSAVALERLVRDAMDFVAPQKSAKANQATDSNGWPVGHFEQYAGSLAGEDWEPPADPPPEPVDD